MGFFEKLKNGLKKTKDSMMGRIESLLHSFSKIDEDLFEELEEALIMADLGVQTTMDICDNLRKRVKKENVTEKLKENNQMERVKLMNNFKIIAEEIVEKELVFCQKGE